MNLLEPTLTAALLCALDGLPANSLRCAPDAAERLLRGRSAPDLAERFAAVLPALCGLFRKVFRLDQRAQNVIEGQRVFLHAIGFV